MSGFDIGKYREMFVEEAEELFESADNVLLEAETNGDLTDEEMGQLFRDVHTLKGSGASVELTYFAKFTHTVENMMDQLRNHNIEFIPEMAGTLIDALDVMKDILQMEVDEEIDDETFDNMTSELLVILKGYINGGGAEETKSETSSNAKNTEESNSSESAGGTDVGFFDGDEDFNPMESLPYGIFGEEEQSSEMVGQNGEPYGFFQDGNSNDTPAPKTENGDAFFAEETSTKPSGEVKEQKEAPKAVKQEQKEAPKTAAKAPKKDKKEAPKKDKKASATNNIRVNLDKIDTLMNNVGDLVITNAMLTQYATTIENSKTRSSVLERLELLERHIREMQDSIMSIRMVPMESIYSKFPKVVRDISKKLGKKVDFKHNGDNVEIDKAMIEGLTDPLMHIIRNSLDHGLETPDERVAAGKGETGTISISAEQANGQMIITIEDDGRGINTDRVVEKALENGLIDENQLSQMTNNEKAMLIFGAGLSTAEQITDISGRGVGMDVVKTNIYKLGGIIKLDTELGKGTVITIMLPLTLAILDGLDIAVGEKKYILPLSAIVESLQPTHEMIKKIGDGTQDLLMLREEFIPVVRLHNLFDVEPRFKQLEEGMLIVVKSGSMKVALFIDEFLHQHQVVVKPLDKNFRSVEGVGAATVRGDGSIGLILDVLGIIEAQKKVEAFIPQIKAS
jgi:two-component system chemotaxis sensor kinase CheA